MKYEPDNISLAIENLLKAILISRENERGFIDTGWTNSLTMKQILNYTSGERKKNISN